MDLEKYYKQQFGGLVNRLTRMIGDRGEAEDRVQNIFLDLLNRKYVLRYILAGKEPNRYFNRAVSLQAMKYYETLRPTLFDPQISSTSLSNSASNALLDYREKAPGYNIIQREQLAQLIPILSRQESENVVILFAKLYWGFSGPEISKSLGITPRSCYVRYKNCIEAIRRELKNA